MTYQDRFIEIIRRMRSNENHERYNSINIKAHNPEEEEIRKICETFTGETFTDGNFTIKDDCKVNNSVGSAKAKLLLDRLEILLNQLGWE